MTTAVLLSRMDLAAEISDSPFIFVEIAFHFVDRGVELGSGHGWMFGSFCMVGMGLSAGRGMVVGGVAVPWIFAD